MVNPILSTTFCAALLVFFAVPRLFEGSGAVELVLAALMVAAGVCLRTGTPRARLAGMVAAGVVAAFGGRSSRVSRSSRLNRPRPAAD